MSKYIIEGNINFQEELHKLLDENSDDEDDNNLCKITGLPLIDKYVSLECGHKFNYDAIYTEIYNQKIIFKTYTSFIPKNDFKKMRELQLDYYIRCPYCRNIQFTILPYYEELGKPLVYGINTTNVEYNHDIKNTHINKDLDGDANIDYSFTAYGVSFKHGTCCNISKYTGQPCIRKYVAKITGTNLSYCKYHWKEGLRDHNKLINDKIKEEKKKELDKKKKEKEDKLNEKKQLLDEKNKERAEKGLPLLKRIIISKKKIENVVEKQTQPIQEYIPEEDGCNAVIKSGPNKGQKCGCKKIEQNGLCKRHCIKQNQKPIEIIEIL